MPAFEELTSTLRAQADKYDAAGSFPTQSLDYLRSNEYWLADIPTEYGGVGFDQSKQLDFYHALAAGDMSITLLMSQRFAAIRWLVKVDDDAFQRRCFEQIVRPDRFVTIGISHLTTSLSSKVQAVDGSDHYTINGEAPWVSGAHIADAIMCAASLEDGRNIVFWLPMDKQGINVLPPIATSGLTHAFTAPVELKNVKLEKKLLMRAPTNHAVTNSARSPFVSAMGLGLLQSCLDAVQNDLKKIPDLRSAVAGMQSEHDELYQHLLQVVGGDEGARDDLTEVRAKVNAALIRVSGLMMLVSKGKGYSVGTTTERLMREAMFFSVWSIPDAIRVETAKQLL